MFIFLLLFLQPGLDHVSLCRPIEEKKKENDVVTGGVLEVVAYMVEFCKIWLNTS